MKIQRRQGNTMCKGSWPWWYTEVGTLGMSDGLLDNRIMGEGNSNDSCQLQLPLPLPCCCPTQGQDSQPSGTLWCVWPPGCSHTPKAQRIKGHSAESLCLIEDPQDSKCLRRCYFSYQSLHLLSYSPLYWEVQGWALFNWLWESYELCRAIN